MTLEQINRLPREAAEEAFLAFCGAREWAERMTAARPFASREEVFARAEAIWRALPRSAWLEAFAAHPRIGERVTGRPAEEQAGVRAAPSRTLNGLAGANREYEERFGHVFLVFATGKTAGEMLAICRERLHNDPETELAIAAAEQEKITRLRLEKRLRG